MKRIKPSNKKALKILAVLLVVHFFIFSALWSYVGGINEYIAQLDIVYTPTKPAFRFYYQIMSIDTFEYWIFKLNDKEEKKILDEVEEGKWSEVNSQHMGRLEDFEYYGKIFGEKYKDHESYICIYDEMRGNIITDSSSAIWEETANWIIFLYDTETNLYYCVYETY